MKPSVRGDKPYMAQKQFVCEQCQVSSSPTSCSLSVASYVTVLVTISIQASRRWDFHVTYCFPPSHGQCFPQISIVTGGQYWQSPSAPTLPPPPPPPPLCATAVAVGEPPGGAVSATLAAPESETVGAASLADEAAWAGETSCAVKAVRATRNLRVAIF